MACHVHYIAFQCPTQLPSSVPYHHADAMLLELPAKMIGIFGRTSDS
jgi:hypothetical protein